MLFAAIAAACIAASANVINDYFDIEIDKINRPERVLAKGNVSPRAALALYFILLLAGVVVATLVNQIAVGIVIGAALLTFFYSYKFKQMPLAGNAVVAFLTGLAFLFGGVAFGKIYPALFPFLFAFVINFMREIVKDMEDVEGDTKANVFTFPATYGFDRAKTLLYIFGLFLLIAMIVPALMKYYNHRYLFVITFLVVPMLFYSMYLLHHHNQKEVFGKVSSLLKTQMLFGLLAILLGS